MRHRLGVSLAGEFTAVFDQPFAQLTEILDDAVMDDGHQIRCVRVRVVLARPAMRCPARMADTDRAAERLAIETVLECAQLAFRASAAERAFLKRGDTGRIVSTIFEALERIDQLARDRLVTDNSDDAAHPTRWPLCPFVYGVTASADRTEIKTHFLM